MTLQFSLDHQSSVLSLKNLLLWYIYLSIWKYLINTKVNKKLEQKMNIVSEIVEVVTIRLLHIADRN
jgi:hypothetical protein